MIVIIDKKDCCGCSACAQTCPVGCITMKPDEEGFDYPAVDMTACLDCGACDAVCPVLHAERKGETVLLSAAARANDEIVREQSSSGGLFSLLADSVLSKGGVVYGAAFMDDFSVAHMRIDDHENLAKLRGSKYLQSRTETTFQEIKEDLSAGRNVLFSGTACQVAALKRFLGEDPENLIAIDVLCHGVPSPAIWNAYLREREAIACANAKTISFRSKTYGWKRFALRIDFQNGVFYEVPFQEDPYMQLFLRNAILRPSCHACRFKTAQRDSDLTLGDAWGVDKVFPDMDDDRGTSIVLVQSEKGARLLECIASELKLIGGDLDTLLPPTADSRKSVASHPKREEFFRSFQRNEPVATILKKTDLSFSQKVKRKVRRWIFD